MTDQRLRRLLNQYLSNTIKRTDCIELLNYLDENADEVAEILSSESFNHQIGPDFTGIQAQSVFQRIKSDSRYQDSKTNLNLKKQFAVNLYQQRWFKIAAILLIFSTAALFKVYYGTHKTTNYTASNNHNQVTIMPAGQKATLTLAGNKTIVLDNKANGLLAKSGRLNIITNNNVLVYSKNNAATSAVTAEPVINTLTTPNGGEYHVVLSDGTKVWLNSMSSISYPAEFTGNERHVKLTGEAYFEVAKNKDKPFYVNINNVSVRVLGTHFNIAAYNNDDNITTTLLEGSVQVTKNNTMMLLKPGQQAVVKNSSDNIMISSADIEEAMAWRNGYFIFNDEDIASIMKKVSRWYDIDVEFKGNFDDQEFGGTFYRSKSINELLHHLEKIGKIHFDISGRRIIVMK